MKPNAERMTAALVFVQAQPGASMRMVIAHVLSTFSEERREKPTAYKQASMVVERIIRDRHVRQAPDLSLYPWDEKRRAYAEAVQRALHAAPTPAEHATMKELACKAWRAAGDENRARILERLVATGQL